MPVQSFVIGKKIQNKIQFDLSGGSDFTAKATKMVSEERKIIYSLGDFPVKVLYSKPQLRGCSTGGSEAESGA